MTLPDYTGRTFFSAAVQNEWSRTLLQYFARAAAPVIPFQTRISPYSIPSGTYTTAWIGYVLYTGDTDIFRYDYAHIGAGGESQILFDGVQIHAGTGAGASGTVDLSGIGGLSLVAGTVYEVQLQSRLSSGSPETDIYWLGLDHDPSYTTPPTLSNGGTYTAANATAVRDGINEIGEAVAMPIGSFGYEETEADHSDDNEDTRWRGYIVHSHNTLRYRLTTASDHPEGKMRWKIYVNSVEVATDTTQGTFEATADLTALGLTRGTRYEVIVTVRRTGTTSTVHINCDTWLLAEESGNTPASVNIWSHGDTDISAGNLNWYRDTINKIHPGAASPDTPIYYRQPAIKVTGSNKYYLRHVRRYLRYRYDGAGTPEVEYGSGLALSVALSATSGNQSYDLLRITGLALGQYYRVDDVDYAQEADTEGP